MYQNLKKLSLAFVSLLILLAASCASLSRVPSTDQQLVGLKSGPQVLTFFSSIDDSEQPYGLFLPENFDPSREYPLVIMLHGAGSNHRLALRRVFGKSNMSGENDLEATRYFPDWENQDYIVASPLARGTMGYQGVPENDVHDVLSDVMERFHIDQDRVYLTGLSMGGGGTMWIGLSRPDIWAAIAPVCPAAPPGTDDLLPNALNVPVSFHQGGADPLVSPEGTRERAERLRELGTNVEYTEYPGVGHNSWENAYEDEAIFDWFEQYRRNRYPDRVRYVTRWYKYNSSYWIQFDKLTPGTLAGIDANFTAPNRLEITTSDLDAFTLNLSGHPQFSPGNPVEVAIDGQALSSSVTGSLSLSKQDGEWIVAKYEPASNSKRSGAEGPLSEAISSRHIYVYGTLGEPTREELQVRSEQASYAADWAGTGFGFMGSNPPLINLRSVADNRVRPSDLESSNLVLFGTRETNSLVAELSDRLPIHLEADAEDYGLLYVYPIDDHYVVVSSGLPWWSVAESAPATAPARAQAGEEAEEQPGPPARPRSISFLPRVAGALPGYADYVLFEGSLDNVVVEGYFNDQWQVPEAEATQLLQTGVISLTD